MPRPPDGRPLRSDLEFHAEGRRRGVFGVRGARDGDALLTAVRLLLGAAPTMSLGEDNSWRSLATAAAVACVWAFFCVVGALSALAAALISFGSSARRSGWNARLAGVLLASTASLAAAAPANASVAPFSDDFSRTRRKLTGVMDDGTIRERCCYTPEFAGFW